MRFPLVHRWAIGLLCLAGSSPVHAKDGCAGAPFVNVMRPRAIEESAGANVGPQIFDVAAHPRGFVLMANNYGLLTYDGVGWRMMPLGRSEVALSVAIAPDGRMFAGGSRTFGEVVEDPVGQLLFQPLESRLKASDRDFSDVWQTLVSSQGVAYFRAPERVIVVRGDEARAHTPQGRYTAIGLVRDVLYANDTALGLVSPGATGLEGIRGGEFFKNVRVTAISEGPEGSLLVGTQDRGLFRFDLARGESHPLGSAIQELQGAEILSVRRLDDGEIAVGTLRSGLFLLDTYGALRFRMDRESGLPDNAILTLQAANGSLWAGTSGGVAQLLLPSPIATFGPREGLPGIVESLAAHDGTIYAATSQGVFRLTCAGRAFEAVPSLRKQAFALISEGTLLAATADGIHEIRGADSRLIRPGLTRAFALSRDGMRLWAATQNGAASLVRKGNTWSPESTVSVAATGTAGTAIAGIEATSIGEDVDGRLWISLATGRVISGVPSARAGGVELTDIQSYGEKEGIASGFPEVISLRSGVRIGLAATVLRPVDGRLVADASLTTPLGTGRGAFRIRDATDGGYWIASGKRPIRLGPLPSGLGIEVRETALLRSPAGSRILDFLEVSANEVWVGTDDGALRYDPSADGRGASTLAASVRRVQSNQRDLFWGGSADRLDAPLPHLAPLRFEVTSSSLDDPSRNRFRFRLDGQDHDWTPWTSDTRKDFTNLGPGLYRFRAETRDVYGRVGKEAAFSFEVLTPWYRKPWAIAMGVALAVSLFVLALNMRTRALRNRQRELETIVDQKTAELREASFSDPLTGLRNRRYFAEVIAGEASLACRPGSPALHMFLVDLDFFKHINDKHGHAAGDEVLRQTSARLKTAMRTSDLIFRWGGEEFLIVARGASDLPRSEIAKRLVRMIAAEPFDIGTGDPLARTCSVGFATFPFYAANSGTVPVDAVIELADLALYRAKQTGRNRAVGVSPQLGEPIPGEAWKNQVLENLEKGAVSVEVIEGPPV